VATVSQLCEAVAQAIPMPVEDVKKYARALINSGDLPKAVGRSIPETTMQDRAKLILAIAASERPSGCVQRMRDSFAARERFHRTELSAGETLAAELQELATGKLDAFQKWEYSDLEVGRGGLPTVQFRINVNVRHFEGFADADWPIFVGGYHLARDDEQFERALKEYETTGLRVSAFVPGRVLSAAAYGSDDAAWSAAAKLSKAYWSEANKHLDEEAQAQGAEPKKKSRAVRVKVRKTKNTAPNGPRLGTAEQEGQDAS
jgi:hypothetical protein